MRFLPGSVVFGRLVLGALVLGGIVVAKLLETPTVPLPLTAPNCADSGNWTTGLLASGGSERFSVDLQAEDSTLPQDLKEQIVTGTHLTYAQWREWLGDDALQKSEIKLRFLGDAQRFKDIYGQPTGKEWTTTGFYRTRSNEALILYTPAYRASALANAFHEISHLMTAWHLGATPPWLNEGLAEYYETLQISAQQTRFDNNALHLQLLQAQGPVPLEQLTSLSRKAWMQNDVQRRYASAWSLIAFMMDSTPGRQTLRRVIEMAHDSRCQARPDLRESLSSYPGGLPGLERDWQAWLQARYRTVNVTPA